MSTYRVSQTTDSKATPETVFALVNDFRQWDMWSPWEEADASVVKTYSGADAGVGAVISWEGKRAGSAKLENKRSDAPAGGEGTIEVELHYLRPFKAYNYNTFTFAPNQSGGTTITWTITGSNDTLFSKVMAKVAQMEKIMNKDISKRIARLAQAAETGQPA